MVKFLVVVSTVILGAHTLVVPTGKYLAINIFDWNAIFSASVN